MYNKYKLTINKSSLSSLLLTRSTFAHFFVLFLSGLSRLFPFSDSTSCTAQTSKFQQIRSFFASWKWIFQTIIVFQSFSTIFAVCRFMLNVDERLGIFVGNDWELRDTSQNMEKLWRFAETFAKINWKLANISWNFRNRLYYSLLLVFNSWSYFPT